MADIGETIGTLAGAYVTVGLADALVRRTRKAVKPKRKCRRKKK